MSIRVNGKLVTGVAASLEPCGWCGCARFMHQNGRGACCVQYHPHAPTENKHDHYAEHRWCSRWVRRRKGQKVVYPKDVRPARVSG